MGWEAKVLDLQGTQVSLHKTLSLVNKPFVSGALPRPRPVQSKSSQSDFSELLAPVMPNRLIGQ